MDSHGTVVLAEAGNNRLTRASSRGAAPNSLQPDEPPQRIGGPGAGPGQFSKPEDVAVTVDGDRIYVADTGNRRVQVLAPTGDALAIWTDVGLPRGIAVGPGPGPDGAPVPDERVYVSDAEGRRVRVYAADGTWLDDWTAGGALGLPLGLTVTPEGDLAVADFDQQRVVWLDADGSEGPAGAEVGAIRLDNSAAPGGAPLDVGVNTDREVFVAVERGVLRFRPSTPASISDPPQGSGVVADLAFARQLPPLRQVPCGGECKPLGAPCDYVQSETTNHEGIQRLDLRPNVGLFITYAPSLRWGDRVMVYPALRPAGIISTPDYNNVNINWAWPKPCRDFNTAEFRHATDPGRIDAGVADPFYAIGLDSAGWLRTWRTDGNWHDGLHETRALRGRDLAVQHAPTPGSAVITGNQVYVFGLLCLLRNNQNPYPPGTCDLPAIDVLNRNQLIRRERTNECRRAEPIPWRPGTEGPCIPDDTFWHTAIGFDGETLAMLDTGQRRAVVRTMGGGLVAGPSLGVATEPFRAFMDLDYDRLGQLWVLARDGALRLFDDRGRDRGEMTLVGPAAGRAEALGMAPDGSFFVLTGDGWVVKYAAETAPPPHRHAHAARDTRPVAPPHPHPVTAHGDAAADTGRSRAAAGGLAGGGLGRSRPLSRSGRRCRRPRAGARWRSRPGVGLRPGAAGSDPNAAAGRRAARVPLRAGQVRPSHPAAAGQHDRGHPWISAATAAAVTRPWTWWWCWTPAARWRASAWPGRGRPWWRWWMP